MGNLLLITFGRTRYGVWEDAVSAVIGAGPLHRLPLSPPAIAGIALLEERSAAIADLGVCLGLPPLKRPQGGTFLIINPHDTIAGFCVEGEIERYECPRELVLPLPRSVATSVSDSCAVRGASLVLIINIRGLHDRLKQGLLDLPSPEPGLPARAFDLSGVRSVRMLSAGGARFCIDARDTGFAVFGEGGIAPVPVRAGRLAGVALHNGAVVPVMLPGAFLGIGDQDGRKGMVLAGPQGSRYGIAVDENLGVVGGHDLELLSLPVLAARPWLPAAALAKGNICLLVDSDVFAVPEETIADRPDQAAFTPSSLFPAQFRQIDTAIVEFSLLGTRHAVPQEEMKDDLPLLPFVPVPGTPDIVWGVAVLRGELLPVLDLAAIFGRRSTVGNKSRMMHLVNGDFKALVITDEVAGSRHLPVEAHRQVPIVLPHQVLYGCYLDAGMVRLILNVEALAVHFETASVRELVAGLSPEINVHREKTQEAPEQADSPAAATIQRPGEASRPGRDRGSATGEYETETAQTGAGDAAPAAALDEERAREETRRQEAVEAAERELAKQRVESERRRAEDDAWSRAVEQARLKAEADAKAIEEIRAQEKAERSRSEAEERARADAEARAQEQETARRKAADEAANKSAAEARKREEEEARRRAEDLAGEAASVAIRRAAEEAEQQRAEEAKSEAAAEARVSAEEEAREQEQEAARQRAAEDTRKREEEEARRTAEDLAGIAEAENLKREADEAQRRQDAEARQRAEADAAENGTMTPVPRTEQRYAPEPRHAEHRPAERKSGKRIGIASMAALLLALVVYFVGVPDKPEQRRTPKPVTSDTTVPVQKIAPQSEKEPPLYLAVPPGKAVPAPFVYTVVKGDNLWNIAKRFTGSPYNYPRVAKDNSIATPDLIFPGQRIHIRNERSPGR